VVITDGICSLAEGRPTRPLAHWKASAWSSSEAASNMTRRTLRATGCGRSCAEKENFAMALV
jgi:hypothetical protein